MIIYSVIVLSVFFSCILIPVYVVVMSDQENNVVVDPRSRVDVTDTFFLKG